MDFARATNFDTVNKLLTMINQEAAQAASCNLQSNLVHLEDTFRDLLNYLSDKHFINANSKYNNYPGIDLIDEESLLCVQITADTSPQKMRDTLAKPVMESLSQKGYTLMFCFIGEQNKNVKRRHPKNPYKIKFDASSNSILTTDILSTFSHLDLTRQEKIIALLKRETNEGYVIDAELMQEKLDRAIKQLGPRYTPEANVETTDMMRLAALVNDELFKNDLLKKAQDAAFDIKHLNCLDVDKKNKNIWAKVRNFFSPLTKALDTIPDEHTPRADFEKWALNLNSVVSNYSQCPISWYEEVEREYTLANIFKNVLHRVQTIEDACQSWGVEYLDNKRVLVCGEAGIGKSHLLADLCEKELAKGNAAILILGSQFYREDSSEESIPDILGLPGSFDDLLDEMQRYVDAREGIAVLAIDALNEGRGRAFWRNSLIPLLEKVSHYPSVRLILSVRTTYKREVLPESFSEKEIRTMECKGFGNISSVALEKLCDYYAIAFPATPLVGMEFSNPLYLKLLCKHLSDCGSHSMTNVEMGSLVTLLLTDINNKLADSQVIGYDRNIPLVTWSAQAIVCSEGFSYGSIKYTDAATAVIKAVRDYVSPSGKFLEMLVSEGLFNVVHRRKEIRLEFSYELVGNYIAASAAVSAAKELQPASESCSYTKTLSRLLAEKYSWMLTDRGVLAALSTICPSECGCELFELDFYHDTPYSPVKEAFVEGIPWRRIIRMTTTLDEFIRGKILTSESSMRSFFSMSFQLVTRRGGVDAWYYENLLLSFSMSQRDYVWSSTIARSEKAKAFVDWVWEHWEELNEQYTEPIAILLTLCFAATNVVLRRKAVKALVLVLMNRPSIAEKLWDDFCRIDDDYVLEGLCGALYGSAVNSNSHDAWRTIGEKVVSAMLNDGNAYPNAIVRDYVMLLSDAVLDSQFANMHPDEPFVSLWKSNWYESLPSNEEINALIETYKDKYGERPAVMWAVRRLVYSMTTEYGRGTGAYGDFGRYVLGNSISAWANQFESDQLLSNALIMHILTKWYNPDLHATYDIEVIQFANHPFAKECERIGKKYQKIAMNRLIARLADNFPPFRLKKIYREGFEEHYKNKLALLETYVSSGNHSAFLKNIDDDSNWVACEKREPLYIREVSHEFLRIRSYDPSFPWKWSTLTSHYELAEIFPNPVTASGNSNDWCKSDTDLPLIDEFRIKYLNGQKFYTIGAYMKWQTRRHNKLYRQSVWISGALLVNKKDVEDIYGHYSGDSVSLDFSGVRFGELFDGWGFELSDSLYQSERFELENKVIEASYLYDWSSDREAFQDESHGIPLPCSALVKHFKLIRSGACEWKDTSGKPVSHCLVDKKTGNYSLIFDANLLDTYLNETSQTLIWDDYFEKQNARHIYRKWVNVKREGEHFRMKDSNEPYYGKIMDIHRIRENDWFDA